MKDSMTRSLMDSPRYTVVGAGNGGKAMAAHLALMGFDVTLYNRTAKHVAMIKARGGIYLDGKGCDSPRGFGRLICVTSDIKEAIHNADIIMIVVPAFAHADIARSMACHLREGQIVILNPGRTLGALEFRHILAQYKCIRGIIIAETQTFIYASRSEGPDSAKIFKIKDAVPLAALPAVETGRVLAAVKPAYPQFIDGGNTLQTGLNNIGAIFHPTISLLNTGWIEATRGKFQFYLEGVTPTVAKVMEVLDRERIMIASAINVEAFTICEWLKLAYNADGVNMHQAIHSQEGYRGIEAPMTLRHRYICEDIPMSLVPLASIGKRFGVSVKGMESIIRLACIAHGKDYWQYGRTMASLGIDHLNRHELKRYFTESDVYDSTQPNHVPTMRIFPAPVHENLSQPGAAGLGITTTT